MVEGNIRLDTKKRIVNNGRTLKICIDADVFPSTEIVEAANTSHCCGNNSSYLQGFAVSF